MLKEDIRWALWAIVFTLAIFGAAMLAGCSELKYAECLARDNTRNPCQQEIKMGIFKNLLTTIPGILTLISVAYQAWETKTIDWPNLQNALVGVGLVFAKDFNVVGK